MFYSTTANITATGTSMACPVVSGIAALYLQANPAALPAEVLLTALNPPSPTELQVAMPSRRSTHAKRTCAWRLPSSKPWHVERL